jgi:NTE family protein
MTHHRTYTALALAGGNALGAYAAGAYEALHERGYPPDVISGLISNSPFEALLDPSPPHDMLCFGVDLFDAHGSRPYSLDTALERTQDIVFSTQASRTLEARGREHKLRRVIHELSSHIPREGQSGRAAELATEGRAHHITVVLIAYRPTAHEVAAKTVDFSRASIDERWSAGLQDMNAALDKLESGRATESADGYTFYDARTHRKAGSAHDRC